MLADRKYGWAPRGVTPSVIRTLKRSVRWSILPAFTINGYLDWMIFQGSITAALFNDFVREQVLPHCTPFAAGGPRSVLIMDNAKIHYNEELRNMCDEAGVLLEYLPPYSPDLNPIETSFAILKAWIRRNMDLAETFAEGGNFGEFLDVAIRAQEGTGDPGNLFRKSGIHYTGDRFSGGELQDLDSESDDNSNA